MGASFTSSGQVENSGSGTAGALDGAVTILTPGASTIYLTITGTWVATLSFEATADGTNWIGVYGVNQTTDVAIQSTAVNGTFGFPCGGYAQFRTRASAYTSGTATVAWNADSNQNPLVAPHILSGYTDGTPIGNVTDRLKIIDAATSVSSKLRFDLVTTPVLLANGSYTTVYSYSGSGFLMGASLEFNNSAVLFRMQIDGETVITAQSIATLGGFQATSNTTDRRQNGQGVIINGANIDISFRVPIRFTSSVSFAADANGGVLLSRQLTQAIIYIAKET